MASNSRDQAVSLSLPRTMGNGPMMMTAPPLARAFPDRREGMTERNAKIRPAIIRRIPIETMSWLVNMLGPLVIAFNERLFSGMFK